MALARQLFGVLLITTPAIGVDYTPRMVSGWVGGMPQFGMISTHGLAYFWLGIWTGPFPSPTVPQVVETRDWGYQKGDGVHGALMIDDSLTTLIMLQPHMPIVQKANQLRGYPKPSRLGVEHPIPNAQLHNK